MERGLRLFPPEYSNFASKVDLLFAFEVAVAAFFTVLIASAIIFFSLRYRRRSDFEVPPRLPSPMALEITWSVVPFGIMLIMFFWGGSLFIKMKRLPEHAMEIHAIGKQWMWKFQHSNGAREIDELHVPVGVPVVVIVSSQDVIHSLGLPGFRVKQDVIPGTFSTLWFTATEVGEYHLFCNQYCGTDHAKMVGRVIAMEPEKYQAWLAGVPVDEPPASTGQRLFVSYGCITCHGVRGPTLAGVYGRQVTLDDGSTVAADENYLRESIIEPAAKVVKGFPTIMPSYRGQLSEEQLIALIAYIKSLGAAVNDNGVMIAPSTQPVNGQSPDRVPNFPPARQPPPVDQPATD